MRHVSVISIPVADQDRARDFYTGAVGLSVVAEAEFDPDRRWIQLGIEGSPTTFALVSGDQGLVRPVA